MAHSPKTSAVFIIACLFYLVVAPALPLEGAAVLKIIPILGLAWLVLRASGNSFRVYLVGALLFSMAGDVLLELGFFAVGLASFLFAQLIYTSIFLRRHVEWSLKLPLSLGLIGVSTLMALLMWANAADMRIPVLVYLLVITVMGLSANTSSIRGATAGAMVFILSDATIAINRFVLAVPASDWLIMLSYYLAQYLLVTSILNQDTPAATAPER